MITIYCFYFFYEWKICGVQTSFQTPSSVLELDLGLIFIPQYTKIQKRKCTKRKYVITYIIHITVVSKKNNKFPLVMYFLSKLKKINM